VEGLERYRFGIKKPSEISKFMYGDVTLRAKVGGDFAGVAFERRSSPDGTRIVDRPVPALAVRRIDRDEFVHFTEQEVLDGTWLDNREVNWRFGFKVIGQDDEVQKIEAALKSRGVVAAIRRPLTPPADSEVLVEQEFRITRDMQRALAKIVFNYLTHTQGTKSALRTEFDPIRRFIRYGEWPTSRIFPVVSHEGLPFSRINAGNVTLQDGEQRPVVHFVGVGANHEYRNIAGAVSLFSFMTHRVILAEGFPGELPGPRAHLYNVRMLEVFELGAAN
jgi:hypothetical protein